MNKRRRDRDRAKKALRLETAAHLMLFGRDVRLFVDTLNRTFRCPICRGDGYVWGPNKQQRPHHANVFIRVCPACAGGGTLHPRPTTHPKHRLDAEAGETTWDDRL